MPEMMMSGPTRVPVAYFDVLSICSRLQAVIGSMSRSELSLFSYFACLLSIYRGSPAAAWGYLFTTGADGLPYSSAIERACDDLLTRGFIVDNEGIINLDESGEKMEALLSSLQTNQDRLACLDGACSVLYSLPSSVVQEGLLLEPSLRTANAVHEVRQLLDGPQNERLMEQFQGLSNAVGIGVEDLMVPGVIWLSFLRKLAEENALSSEGEK